MPSLEIGAMTPPCSLTRVGLVINELSPRLGAGIGSGVEGDGSRYLLRPIS